MKNKIIKIFVDVKLLAFFFLLLPFIFHAQDFKFDYILSYGYKKENRQIVTIVFFLDSTKPNAKMFIDKDKNLATIFDSKYYHQFKVIKMKNKELAFDYLYSKKNRPSGIIEKKAIITEEQFGLRVKFYVNENSISPNMVYCLNLKEYDYDFASPILSFFFDSTNRATFVKLDKKYIIQSVFHCFSDDLDKNSTENTLQLLKIEKNKNPISISIYKTRSKGIFR